MRSTITTVAVLTAATGLYSILQSWFSYRHVGDVVNGSIEIGGWPLAGFSLVVLLVPVAKLIAAGGLAMFRRSAWWLAVVTLAVDVVLRAHGAIRVHLGGMLGSQQLPASVTEGVVVHVESLWPSYFIITVGVVSVMLLLKKEIRKRYLSGSAH